MTHMYRNMYQCLQYLNLAHIYIYIYIYKKHLLVLDNKHYNIHGTYISMYCFSERNTLESIRCVIQIFGTFRKNDAPTIIIIYCYLYLFCISTTTTKTTVYVIFNLLLLPTQNKSSSSMEYFIVGEK